ncbi:hypothetical protein VCHA50O407_100047 [Vibrio chagasii]|nr:hypothetical protein VCHA50O407_100047 [Vibrio chagasii]
MLNTGAWQSRDSRHFVPQFWNDDVIQMRVMECYSRLLLGY